MTSTSVQELPKDVIGLLKRHNLLKSLLRAETIEQEVKSVELSQEECDRVFNSYVQKHNIQSDTELNEHLTKLGINLDSLHWQLELPIRIEKQSYKEFKHKSEARFLSQKEHLDKVVYSLLRVKDGFLSRELYLRIASKEANFADLAEKFSEGHEANTKGIVGPVPMKQSHPILAEKLRISRPGELLEPFCIGDWWIVARLERYAAARFDDSTAKSITKELFQERVEEKVICKMQELSVVD